jgi:LCP family protein required for cell wall assembly
MQRQNVVLWMIIIIALGSLLLSFVVVLNWNTPLGPVLNLPTLTQTATFNAPRATEVAYPSTALPSLTIEAPTSSVQQATLEPTQTPRSQPLCNGPQTMTILLIGSDARDPGYLYGLADSIHVIRIDFSIPNIMVIDFPRDLWVEIPGISDHYGITHGKLNQAYFYGNPGMGYYDGPGEGPGLLARTLDLNFGLRVDRYIAVDTQTFMYMIDAIGGVDVQVEYPIDLNYGMATPDPKLYLSVGTHHLDGELAYALATNRIPTTFQRMKYEKIIMSALREKLLKPQMLPKLPLLVARFITSVQTDFSLSDITSLICITQAVPSQNIMADSFPQDMFTPSSIYDPHRGVTTFIYDVDFNKLREMVAEFVNGIWPIP